MDNILSQERFQEALDRKGWSLPRLANEYDEKYLDEDINASSIYKTLVKWNSGNANPTMKKFTRICDLLECDVDYMLGRMEEHTHTHKFIHEQTGLAESSINILAELYHDELRNIKALDFLLERENFCDDLLARLASHYQNCRVYFYIKGLYDNSPDDDTLRMEYDRMVEQLEIDEYEMSKTFDFIMDEFKRAAELGESIQLSFPEDAPNE